jgi:hypothetical protein
MPSRRPLGLIVIPQQNTPAPKRQIKRLGAIRLGIFTLKSARGFGRFAALHSPLISRWGNNPMARRPKPVHQLTAAEFESMFPDEEACCAYLVARRWPEGVTCPRCGAVKPHKLPNRPWSWQCYQCAPDTSYRVLPHSGDHFREHKQAAPRLVQGHASHVDFQKGH